MNKVYIDRFNTDGSGHAEIEGKTLHIWNALPQEEVVYEIVAKRKGHRECIATEIIMPSKHRVLPQEQHFTSCSPWQIISFKEEMNAKKQIALSVFKDLPEVLTLLEKSSIFSDTNEFHYRNKMEYHIYTDEENNFHLGIFGRTQKKKIPISPCVLATHSLNSKASEIIDWLDKVKFPRPLLKTLILRSNKNGDVVACLFTKTEEIEILKQNPFNYLSIFYSEPKSPASVPTELLLKSAKHTVTENIGKVTYTFGVNSFFQINPDVFEEALKDIATFIPQGASVLDFYCGVGTIGLSLKDKVSKLIMVEENAEAVEFGKINIKQNNVLNAEIHLGQAHTLLEFISDKDILIVDPPRGGLHPKVIKRIKHVLPETVIYLSCNIESQARDIEALKEEYDPVFMRLYNFFPKTPHVESLIVLKKKQ